MIPALIVLSAAVALLAAALVNLSRRVRNLEDRPGKARKIRDAVEGPQASAVRPIARMRLAA